MLTLEDRNFIGQSLDRHHAEVDASLAELRGELRTGFATLGEGIEKLALLTHDEIQTVHKRFDTTDDLAYRERPRCGGHGAHPRED